MTEENNSEEVAEAEVKVTEEGEENSVLSLSNPAGDEVFSIRPDPNLPETVGSIDQIANWMVKSGYFKSMTHAAQAAVLIATGREYGLADSFAMSNLYVVKGKIAMEADVMATLIQRSGRFQYRVRELTSETATLEFFEHRRFAVEVPEDDRQWISVGFSTFNTRDAARARLHIKSTYKEYPRNMLFARALSNGARWYCPAIFGGPVYVPEELEK